MVLAAEFLLGHAEPPEDTAAKATWNKKKVYLRFQLRSTVRTKNRPLSSPSQEPHAGNYRS